VYPIYALIGLVDIDVMPSASSSTLINCYHIDVE